MVYNDPMALFYVFVVDAGFTYPFENASLDKPMLQFKEEKEET